MRRSAAGGALTWGFVAAVALWGVGRLFTDASHATQFLFWIPTPTVLAFGAAALVAARWLSPPCPDGRQAHRRAQRVASLALLAVLVHAVVEGRLLAAGPAPASSDRTLRVAYWNPSWGTTPGLAEVVRRSDADVFVVGDQPSDVPWERVRDAMGGSRSALWAMNSVVLSRHPIRRWGATSLEIEGVREQHRTNPDGTPRVTRQRGRAIWFELDTADAAGRPVVIWSIDMPSDPLLDRGYAGRQAARAVREWRGPTLVRSPEGRDVPEIEPREGFPRPDLIVGDFNTHRGAASLRELTSGTRDAFRLAGRGLMGTFPRVLPLWHVDLAFVGPDVRVRSYRLLDPGEGRHRMQIVDLEVER